MNASSENAFIEHENYRPINKVLPLVEMTSSNFKKCYIHHKQLSVDEAIKGIYGCQSYILYLIFVVLYYLNISGYNGRGELVMYSPMKPNKFVIKFWALCDGVSPYMSKYTLYYGKKDKNAFQEEHGLGHKSGSRHYERSHSSQSPGLFR